MEIFKTAIRYTERFLPLMTRLCILLGGGLFVYYGISHDAMPDSLSLGDSVRLIIIAVVSGFNTALGLVLVVLPAASCLDLVRRLCILGNRWSSRSVADQRAKAAVRRKAFKKIMMLLPEFNLPVYSSLFVWVVYGIVLVLLGQLVWVGKWLILLFIFSVLIWFSHLYFSRRSFLNRPGPAKDRKKKDRRAMGILSGTLLLVAVFITFILGFIRPVADATMKTMSIRQENISLFVKSPSAEILRMYLPASVDPGNPAGYSRFDNVTLSLSGMGSTDAVELKDGKRVFSLRLPAGDVLPAPGLKTPESID